MPDNPWAAAAMRATASSPRPAAVTGSMTVDRCPVHAGVRWYSDRPCFLCDPDAWLADPPPEMHGNPMSSSDEGGISACIAEMIASGHWQVAPLTSPQGSDK